jgi:phage-related protein
VSMPTDEWKIVGYQDARGRRPVNEFLDALPAGDRARVVRTIELLKTYGVELGMPYSRHLTGKLWELRVSSGRLDYRVLYFAHTSRRFVLLHAFSKKTQKTPRREIEVALRRMAELLEQKE